MNSSSSLLLSGIGSRSQCTSLFGASNVEVEDYLVSGVACANYPSAFPIPCLTFPTPHTTKTPVPTPSAIDAGMSLGQCAPQ